MSSDNINRPDLLQGRVEQIQNLPALNTDTLPALPMGNVPVIVPKIPAISNEIINTDASHQTPTAATEWQSGAPVPVQESAPALTPVTVENNVILPQQQQAIQQLVQTLQSNPEAQERYQTNRALAQQGFGSEMASRYNLNDALNNGGLLPKLGENAVDSLNSLGTGITAMGAIIPKAAQYALNLPMSTDDYNFMNEIFQQTGDFLRYATPEQKASTAVELLLTGNLLPAQDIEEIRRTGNYGAIVPTMLNNWFRDPVQGSIDLLTGVLAGAGGLGAGLKLGGKVFGRAGKLANMANKASKVTKPSQAAKNIYDVANATAAQNLIKTRDAGKALQQFNIKDLTKAVESCNIGTKVSGNVLRAKEALRAFQSEWKKVVNNFAPYSIDLTDSEFAAIQYTARKLNSTFDKVRKEVNLLTDMTPEELAKNKVIELYTQGLDLYKKGEIFPLTQADAKGASKILDALANNSETVKYAGKATTRIAGNAPYEEVAKALKNNGEWLDKKAGEIVKSIAKESIKANGEDLEKGLIKGELRYANPEEFEGIKDLEELSLSKTKDAVNSLPVDEKLVKALSKYDTFFKDSNPYAKGSLLAEGYTIGKGVKLGSGKYLAGNAITGTANMLLNSGAELPLDIAQALASKGELSRNLGTFREMRLPNAKAYTPFGKVVAATNKPISSALNAIDTHMQNFFGEVAAHNNLRSKGIPFKERTNKVLELTQKDEQTLANIINDVRRVALIQSGDSWIAPRYRGFTALTTGDFWRWHEEALRSASHMMKKRPYLSGLVINRLMGNVGFDREMQHRFGIQADMDKPNIHLKMDYRDGQFKEVSSEVVPIMNSIKFSSGLAQTTKDKGRSLVEALGQASPWTTTILNAGMGIDRYGNPIKREGATIDYKTKKRYINGQEIGGLKPDEVITAIANTFSVYPSLYNRTLAPTAGMFTGRNFYQPYGNSIFGSFTPDNPLVGGESNLFFSGNPTRPTTPLNSLDSFAGLYESRYYDENRPDHPAMLRSLIKSDMRNRNKLMQEYQRYLNESGEGGEL